jgi:hypothetical protein
VYKLFRYKQLAVLNRAVLHDKGVVFNAMALGFDVVSITSRIPNLYRLSIGENVLWVDIDGKSSLPDQTTMTAAPNPSASHEWFLLVPKNRNKLDAEGTVGKGIRRS